MTAAVHGGFSRIAIAEMKWLTGDIEQNGAATSQEEAQQRPVREFEASP